MTIRHGRRRSLSDPFVARAAAVALVENGFDTAAAMRKVRPHVSEHSAHAHGYKLLREPEIIREIDKIMAKSGRSAEKFLAETGGVWDRLLKVLDAGEVPPRHLIEAGLASQRILAKALLNDSGDKDKQPAPSVSFGNIGADEIASMTESQTGAANGANGVKRIQ